MTTYTVHLYREMRLVFPDISAGSHEEAARIAEARPTNEAAAIEDCDGLTLSAVVDVDGDGDYSQSRFVNLGEDGCLLDAAPSLLAALEQAVAALNTVPRFRVRSVATDSYQIAALCDRAIAKAKGDAR